MRLLLDSHAFIWFAAGSPRLSATARRAISDDADEIWLSHASVWEIVIKQTTSRLDLSDPPEEMAGHLGMSLLSIGLHHIRGTARLPPIHGDPFDRMLIAQAIEDGFVLVSADANIQRYPVSWLW
jgi:PIN domain nuclease of toxin-antitoxin system